MKKLLLWFQHHKIIVAVIGTALIIGSLWASRYFRILATPLEKKYQTAAVARQDISQIVSASGSVQAENKVILKFQTSGKLAWVGIKEGDWVNQWQAVAALDKYELQRTLVKALRDYSSQRNDFEQEYRVTYHEQTPQAALNDTVKRLLEKNQWDLDKAVADVEVAEYAIKMATLISPIEGLVTDVKNAIVGSNIVFTNTEFTIINPQTMKFVANVDELDIGHVQVGQEVKFFLDAYPEQEFGGRIGQIAFSAIITSGGSTAFPVEVALGSNDRYQFKDGMNGDCEIIIFQKEAILTIPNEALRQDGDKQFVQIIDNRQIKEVEVQTGLESDTAIEITGGLEEGQLVITGDAA